MGIIAISLIYAPLFHLKSLKLILEIWKFVQSTKCPCGRDTSLTSARAPSPMFAPKGFYDFFDLMISLLLLFLIVNGGRKMNGRVNISNHLLTSISTLIPPPNITLKRGLKGWWKMSEKMSYFVELRGREEIRNE